MPRPPRPLEWGTDQGMRPVAPQLPRLPACPSLHRQARPTRLRGLARRLGSGLRSRSCTSHGGVWSRWGGPAGQDSGGAVLSGWDGAMRTGSRTSGVLEGRHVHVQALAVVSPLRAGVAGAGPCPRGPGEEGNDRDLCPRPREDTGSAPCPAGMLRPTFLKRHLERPFPFPGTTWLTCVSGSLEVLLWEVSTSSFCCGPHGRRLWVCEARDPSGLEPAGATHSACAPHSACAHRFGSQCPRCVPLLDPM